VKVLQKIEKFSAGLNLIECHAARSWKHAGVLGLLIANGELSLDTRSVYLSASSSTDENIL